MPHSSTLAYLPEELPAPDKKSQAILVLGMHRSGTSALMRICNLLGVSIGNNLLPPRHDNETGFWEHAEMVDIHDALLKTLGSGWDDIRPLPENWLQLPEVQPFKEQLKQVITRDFEGQSLWGIKDPRLALLAPLWVEILEEMGIEPLFLIPVRYPYDIAGSLHKRDSFPLQKGLLLWLDYLLAAEKASRAKRRVFVSYEGLLTNWRDAMATVTDSLGITWPVTLEKAESSIQDFINPGLQHHKQASLLQGEFSHIESWVKQAQEAVQSFLQGNEPKGQKQIDALATAMESVLAPAKEILTICYQDTQIVHQRMIDACTRLHHKDLYINEHMAGLADELAEERKKHFNAATESAKLRHELTLIVNSRLWKMLAPLRTSIEFSRNLMALGNNKALRRIYSLMRTRGVSRIGVQLIRLVQQHGIAGALQLCKRNLVQETNYDRWIRENDTLTENDRISIRNHIQSFAHKPLISIVMPVYNIEERWLRAAIDSVLGQLYPHWELCIADDCSPAPHIRTVLEEYQAKDSRVQVVFREQNGHISEASNSALALATGEFIALLDHDDTLPEHALYHVAHEINQHPDVDLIYSDEDKINENGDRFGPYFKTDWNPDLFYAQNMFCHLGIYRHSILKTIGGFRKGYEGSQDYDIALRALLHSDNSRVRHIPKVLYHWRAIEGSTALDLASKSYAVDTSRQAIKDYFAAAYPGSGITVTDAFGIAQQKGYHRIQWPLPNPAPKVTLLIPTRNSYHLLRTCIESILAKTTYPNYEIVILNNQSDDPETLNYFAALKGKGNIQILDYDEPFNFSAINNFGVSQTKGEVLGFINNDIAVITPNWLEEMVSNALRPDIGAVGAKLYYPNDTIQHGGVLLGVGIGDMIVAGHAFYHLPKNDPGYYARAILTQNLSAVTAACMVVRREVFEAAGGFDEEHLCVAFNDVDFCLKAVEKGYRNLWTPYAELYHYESATRGYEDTPEKVKRFRKEQAYMRKRWGSLLDNDPFYSPNLNAERGDFSLAQVSKAPKPWME